MPRHYLFFVSHSYCYTILRPLQQAIRRRGDDVAWFLEDSCPDLLQPNELRLHTITEVRQYNPLAVFAPGNYVYSFFPGVKVELFHGYPINKRNDLHDDHFKLRGWFDIYCTQGPSSTEPFRQLESRHRYFKVYETGWCKVDALAALQQKPSANSQPTIVYATTFTRGISSAPVMIDVIEQLAAKRPWHWMLTLHPKISDPQLIARYQALADRLPNVTFHSLLTYEQLAATDVMLCDTSSIIMEYLLLDKPVVTYRNTRPGDHLLNVTDLADVPAAIEQALTRPADLLQHIRAYAAQHEAHTDGHNSERVLDAVDDFLENYQGHLPHKPLNLFRKLKQRLKILTHE